MAGTAITIFSQGGFESIKALKGYSAADPLPA
jgi:hypothetical protein